jgi:hypothetical protein
LSDVSFSIVQACALERWSPVIGDPGIMGWLTVATYLLAAFVAAMVAKAGTFPMQSRRKERLFWLVISAMMIGLALNKQLDLQSYMTAVARCAAQFQGWYADRRTVQVSVIAGLVTGMVIVGGLISVAMRGTWRRSFLPLMGLVFVICFVAVRAVGFHHVDRLINLRAQDFRLNALLELAGPVLIIAGGLLLLRFAPERPVSRE